MRRDPLSQKSFGKEKSRPFFLSTGFLFFRLYFLAVLIEVSFSASTGALERPFFNAERTSFFVPLAPIKLISFDQKIEMPGEFPSFVNFCASPLYVIVPMASFLKERILSNPSLSPPSFPPVLVFRARYTERQRGPPPPAAPSSSLFR